MWIGVHILCINSGSVGWRERQRPNTSVVIFNLITFHGRSRKNRHFIRKLLVFQINARWGGCFGIFLPASVCVTSSLELYFNKIRHLLWWISDFVAATSTFGQPAWHPLNFHLKKPHRVLVETWREGERIYQFTTHCCELNVVVAVTSPTMKWSVSFPLSINKSMDFH